MLISALILLFTLNGLVESQYAPSGWRPDGPAFKLPGVQANLNSAAQQQGYINTQTIPNTQVGNQQANIQTQSNSNVQQGYLSTQNIASDGTQGYANSQSFQNSRQQAYYGNGQNFINNGQQGYISSQNNPSGQQYTVNTVASIPLNSLQTSQRLVQTLEPNQLRQPNRNFNQPPSAPQQFEYQRSIMAFEVPIVAAQHPIAAQAFAKIVLSENEKLNPGVLPQLVLNSGEVIPNSNLKLAENGGLYLTSPNAPVHPEYAQSYGNEQIVQQPLPEQYFSLNSQQNGLYYDQNVVQGNFIPQHQQLFGQLVVQDGQELRQNREILKDNQSANVAARSPNVNRNFNALQENDEPVSNGYAYNTPDVKNAPEPTTLRNFDNPEGVDVLAAKKNSKLSSWPRQRKQG